MNHGYVLRRIPAESPIHAALPYVAAAAVGAALASALAFGQPVRIGVPLGLLAIASKRAFDAARSRTDLRSAADDWLANATLPSSEAFAWRVEELLGSERKAVGCVLRSYAEEISRPWRPGCPRLNRRCVRRDADLLATVADALRDDGYEVPARAVVRARILATDPGSPLHCAARHAELRGTLEEILADVRRA